MVRLAMKIAYDGSSFHGSARQPRLRTVEGEVVHALLRAHAIGSINSSRFETASRTDRGVSALGNVVAFDSSLPPVATVRAFNAKARDVWAWAVSAVPGTFRARQAKERWYRYRLHGTHDVSKLASALGVFEGEHLFHNFTRDKTRSATRIDVATAALDSDTVVLDFRAPSFRWNLVRRLVAAGLLVEAGKATLREVTAALQPGRSSDFGLADAEPLVLMDVLYDVDFESVMDLTTEQRLRRLVDHQIRNLRFHQDVLGRWATAAGRLNP